MREHLALLCGQVFGNPHCVLSYFRASPQEYEVIFTANASGALKLVGESYPFAPDGLYLLTFDNHNSVNGIREFARAQGAAVVYQPLEPPDPRVNESHLQHLLAAARPGQPNLFAYPAQSNVTGVQHSLDWIACAQEQGWDYLSIVPRLSLATVWISHSGILISFLSRFTRCLVTPPGWTAYWPAGPRSPGCVVPGLPAERSHFPRCSLALDFT
jgi:hypothetical protein